LHILLWKVGCTTDLEVYKIKREELKAACKDTDYWIETSLQGQEHQWALSKNGGYRLFVMTTITSESFNGM